MKCPGRQIDGVISAGEDLSRPMRVTASPFEAGVQWRCSTPVSLMPSGEMRCYCLRRLWRHVKLSVPSGLVASADLYLLANLVVVHDWVMLAFVRQLSTADYQNEIAFARKAMHKTMRHDVSYDVYCTFLCFPLYEFRSSFSQVSNVFYTCRFAIFTISTEKKVK